MKFSMLILAATAALAASSAQAASVGTGVLRTDSSLFANSSSALSGSGSFADRLASLSPVRADPYRGPTSRLPTPSTWAMLVMGFGSAGAMVRRRRDEMTYRLEETAPDGSTLTDEFAAPDDRAALSRAASVVSGEFKLWRGNVVVQG